MQIALYFAVFSCVVLLNYAFAVFAGQLMSTLIPKQSSRAKALAVLAIGGFCVLLTMFATPFLATYAFAQLTHFSSLAGWVKFSFWFISFLLSAFFVRRALERALRDASWRR